MPCHAMPCHATPCTGCEYVDNNNAVGVGSVKKGHSIRMYTFFFLIGGVCAHHRLQRLLLPLPLSRSAITWIRLG